MPNRANMDERAREPSLRKLFLGSHVRAEREEKVLRYIIHRVNESAPLHDVVQEDYVRRNCTQAEIDEIVNAPELVHACRENLWQTFKSGELDPLQPRPVVRRQAVKMAAIRFRRARDDASMSGLQDRCDHSGPTEVERAEGCYRARCTACGKSGPARKTAEAARKALVVLGARDGTRGGWRVGKQ